jgi:major membrane immunogen (membrane-anchored lipoprotein)
VSDNSIKPDGAASPTPTGGAVDAAPVFNGQTGMQQLTDSERQTLYAMVVSKLNQAQLKQLSDSLQGGLTAEELDQLQTMLKSVLTDDQYTQMMELLQGSKKTITETISE